MYRHKNPERPCRTWNRPHRPGLHVGHSGTRYEPGGHSKTMGGGGGTVLYLGFMICSARMAHFYRYLSNTATQRREKKENIEQRGIENWRF